MASKIISACSLSSSCNVYGAARIAPPVPMRRAMIPRPCWRSDQTSDYCDTRHPPRTRVRSSTRGGSRIPPPVSCLQFGTVSFRFSNCETTAFVLSRGHDGWMIKTKNARNDAFHLLAARTPSGGHFKSCT